MRRRRTLLISPALGAAAAALALAGCGGYGGGSTTVSAPAPAVAGHAHHAVVGVRDTSLGRILVDGQGRTLYRFGKDTGARSVCAGACATNWPPFLTTGRPTAGAGASAASVASSPRPDGGRGVTYAGHPLYAFSGDSAPGDTNGEGIEAFGGRWDAVTASGAVTVSSTTRGY